MMDCLGGPASETIGSSRRTRGIAMHIEGHTEDVTRLHKMAAAMSGATHRPNLLPLVARGLCFDARGRRLLHDLDFTVSACGVTMVMGPNGAGKSLLLRLCNGLLAPSAGTLSWTAAPGVDVSRHQAFVFQRPVLLRRSALANVEYALKMAGVRRRERRARAFATLERAGIAHLADRAARVLSGGEQQRLAIARAWAVEPSVLLLDEPTAALDPHSTQVVEDLVAEIHAGGTKIIMTTHDLGQARRLADDILLLHHGRLQEHTPADTFFRTPRSEEGHRFLRGDLMI